MGPSAATLEQPHAFQHWRACLLLAVMPFTLGPAKSMLLHINPMTRALCTTSRIAMGFPDASLCLYSGAMTRDLILGLRVSCLI